MKYKVLRGLVEVKASAGVVDTVTRFAKVTGTIELDADAPADTARAEVNVDMRGFDAGDRFKNWKIESDLEADKHPEARFMLARLEQVNEEAPGKFRGQASGQLRWRGQALDIRVRGHATVTRRDLELRGGFDLDLRKLGLAPTSFLMFRNGDLVRVDVLLVARP
jgi:polyisoprenoid-binding protein YceI